MLTYLVQSCIARQDDVRIVDLDDTLTQTEQIRTDADGTARDHRNGHNFIVRLRRFSGDHTGVPQVLHTQTVFLANDVGDLVPAEQFKIKISISIQPALVRSSPHTVVRLHLQSK